MESGFFQEQLGHCLTNGASTSDFNYSNFNSVSSQAPSLVKCHQRIQRANMISEMSSAAALTVLERTDKLFQLPPQQASLSMFASTEP